MGSGFRLTFKYAASPGCWGLMAPAAENAHCNTIVERALILPDGKAMMSHVKILGPRETKKPTQLAAWSERGRIPRGRTQ